MHSLTLTGADRAAALLCVDYEITTDDPKQGADVRGVFKHLDPALFSKMAIDNRLPFGHPWQSHVRVVVGVTGADLVDALGAAHGVAEIVAEVGERVAGPGFRLAELSMEVDEQRRGGLARLLRSAHARDEVRRRGGGRTLLAAGLFVVVLSLMIGLWWVGIGTPAIVGAGIAAVAAGAGTVVLWPRRAHAPTTLLLTAVATLTLVLVFAVGYAICADHGAIRHDDPAVAASTQGSGASRPAATDMGQPLYVAASLGAAPDLKLTGAAVFLAYLERLLFLGFLTSAVVRGLGAVLEVVRETSGTRRGVDLLVARSAPAADDRPPGFDD